MTSTNDGKDVKSNQTSGQKGKTYYIELYKSLEARLSGECSGEQRTRLVCEAWRRVHSLCQHSAPTTHPHLLAWLQRHTSHTILQTEWQSPKSKEQHVWLEEAIDAFIAECGAASSTRDGTPAWEAQLLHRAQWFRTVLSNPWGHPVLKALLDSRGIQPTDDEVLGWLKEERGVMFVTRLRQLAASKCDDLALLLATAVMTRSRDGVIVVPDIEQAADPKGITDQSEAPKIESTFVAILRKEAGFTVDVWELLTDIEFVLLHKGESRSRCIELAKQTPLRHGYQLVERLHSRLEMSPRDKKLWKNAKDVATLIAQVVVARCMVVPTCGGAARVALYGCARSLARLLPEEKLPTAAAALAAPAATSRHLHTLATAIHAQCKDERKSFVCELYVRAITAGMNELERLKLKTEKESEARSMEQTLSTWFIQLGTLLSASSRLSCECVLTAFSVHPSPFMYERVKAAAPLAPILKDIQEPRPETNSEFGSWATDSRTQTNLVKTSETLNLKQTQKQANVLSTAIFAEGEALGLGAELCQDLAVLISGPRVKTLTWDMDRQLLLESCRTYMERTHGGTRALTTELKYLNLDPRSFQHLPEEVDDENNAFYGIEKGYEHLVEFQEPEEIWQDALSDDPEKTDSACSMEELPIVIPRRKKKSKRLKYSSDEETDPLSLVADTKRTEMKERPHSKERSKERKERKDKTKSKEQSTKETGESTEQVQLFPDKTEDKQKKEKKKERKERKKKEKAERKLQTQPIPRQGGPLSRLVGMKVARILEFNPHLKKSDSDFNINHNVCVTDSDYDSQGKSSITSINSEGNDADVLFDGLFSMDEVKSPEKSSIDGIQRPKIPKREELSVSNGVIVNNTLSVPNVHRIVQPQQQQKIQLNITPDAMSAIQSDTNEDVREEVKKSIKKLIQFRRNKNFTDVPTKLDAPNLQSTFIPDNNIPLYANQSTYANNSKSPLENATSFIIPKVNLNNEKVKQLNALKDEVNTILKNCKGNFEHPTLLKEPVKQNITTNSITYEKTNDKVINRDLLQVCGSSIRNYEEPLNKTSDPFDTKTIKPVVVKNIETPSQIQYKEFLKQRSFSVIKTQSQVNDVTNVPSQKQLQNLVKDQASKQVINRPKLSNVTTENLKRDFSKQVTPKPSHMLNTKSDNVGVPNLSLESSRQCPSKSLHLQNVSRQSVTNANASPLSPSQNHFQSFLKELQETINAGASKEKSEIKCSSVPEKTNTPKQIIQQKKVDNAPNTFSRLSYLHKNKQNDNKNKAVVDQTKPVQNMPSDDKQNFGLNLDKVNHLQSKGEIIVSRIDKTKSNVNDNTKVVVQKVQNFKCLPSSKNTPLCLNRQYPIISNMLMSDNINYSSKVSNENESKSIQHKNTIMPVASSASFPTDKDNNDLLLLLRQQSKMCPLKFESKIEAPKIIVDCSTTLNANLKSTVKSDNRDIRCKNSHNVNRVVTDPENSIAPTDVSPSPKVSTNKSSSSLSELKKVRNVKGSGKGPRQTAKSNESSDWESVMNALLAQKTPSRGPNALDIVLKKDSFEKRSSNNPENQNIKTAHTSGSNSRTVIDYANLKQCPIKSNPASINTGTTMLPGTHASSPQLKQIQDKKISCKINTIELERNSPLDFNEKHFPNVIQNTNDPFISGIPNSDYDLLEELMDDDLRKEIGELMSDEEAYCALQCPKTRNKAANSFVNKYPNHRLNSLPIRKTQTLDSCQNLDLLKNKNITLPPKPVKDLLAKCTSLEKPVTQTESNSSTLISNNVIIKPQIISNELVTSSTINQQSNLKISNNIHPVQAQFVTPETNLNISNVCNKNTGINTTATSKIITHVCNKPKNEEVSTPEVQKSNTGNVCNSKNIVLDPTRVILTVPQRNVTPNMMLISNDLICDPYSTIQIEQSNRNTYVLNQAPNLTLYRTTQFVAPCVNPVIIERASTMPVVNRVSPNILTNLSTNKTLKPENSETEIKTTAKLHQENKVKTEVSKSNNLNYENNIETSKIVYKTSEINNSSIRSSIAEDFKGLACNVLISKNQTSNKKIKTDSVQCNMQVGIQNAKQFTQQLHHNSNRDTNNETVKIVKPFKQTKKPKKKIPNEVQENMSLLGRKSKAEIKTPIKDYLNIDQKCEQDEDQRREEQRIQRKRMLLLNRQINYRCYDKPIALTYEPIMSTKEVLKPDETPTNENAYDYNNKIGKNITVTHGNDKETIYIDAAQNITPSKVVENQDESKNSFNNSLINSTKETENSPVSPCRRIMLQCSNVIKDTTILASVKTSDQETKSMDKPKSQSLLTKCPTISKAVLNKVLKNKPNKSTKLMKLSQFGKQIKHKTKLKKSSVSNFGTKITTPECILAKNEDSIGKTNFTCVDIEEQITSAVIPNIFKEMLNKQTENTPEQKQEPQEFKHLLKEKYPLDSTQSIDSLKSNDHKDSNINGHTQTTTKIINCLENTKDKIIEENKHELNNVDSNNVILKTKSSSCIEYIPNMEMIPSFKEKIVNVNDNFVRSDICKDLEFDQDDQKSDKDTCSEILSEISNEEPSKTTDKNILDYKNKVIFEEIPSNNNDPLKKFVRIKLPNGNTFKATISGKLSVNIDSLFEDPKIKELIWKNINNNKKCTLNIKQVAIKTPHTSRTVLTNVHDISYPKTPAFGDETIDLVSDDENTTQTFKTEFGNYDIAFMNQDMFMKHQNRFSQKSVVQIERCSTLLTNRNAPKSQLPSKSCKDDLDVSIKHVDLTPSMSLQENITDFIEIDDSSNESEINNVIPNTNVNITKLTENVDALKNLLLKDLGIEGTDIKSKNAHERVSFPFENSFNKVVAIEDSDEMKSKECLLKIKKCDELVEKMKIQQNLCFVSLVRCDDTQKYLEKNGNVLTQTNLVQKSEFLQGSLDENLSISEENYNKESNLKRSGSLSILEDFLVSDERKSTQVCQSIENIDALKEILPITSVFFGVETEKICTCNTDWFMTKSDLYCLYRDNANMSFEINFKTEKENIKDDDVSTDCDSDMETNLAINKPNDNNTCNLEQMKNEVPSLVKLTVNYFVNNNNVIENLRPTQFNLNVQPMASSSPLKRKLTGILNNVDNKNRNKISKIENFSILQSSDETNKKDFLKINNDTKSCMFRNKQEPIEIIGKEKFLSIKEVEEDKELKESKHSVHCDTIVDSKVLSGDKILIEGKNVKKVNEEVSPDKEIQTETNCEKFHHDLGLCDKKLNNYENCHEYHSTVTNCTSTISNEVNFNQHLQSFQDELNKTTQPKLDSKKFNLNDIEPQPTSIFANNDFDNKKKIIDESINDYLKRDSLSADDKIEVIVPLEEIDDENIQSLDINTNDSGTNDANSAKNDLNIFQVKKFQEVDFKTNLNIIEENYTKEPKSNSVNKLYSKTLFSNEVLDNNIENKKIDILSNAENLKQQNETKYSLNEKDTKNKSEAYQDIEIRNQNNEDIENGVKHNIDINDTAGNKTSNVYGSIPNELNTLSLNDSSLQKNVTLVYKGDSSVVLKGSIYEDPIVGTCYVFPILNRAAYSDEIDYNNICDEKTVNVIQALKNKVLEDQNTESDEKENSNHLNVVIPKITYSRQRFKDNLCKLRTTEKKNLKRKSDTSDNKLNEKRYRKGKNIDYPKITVTAMSESAYSKEYKRLFNYCSSIKFSFSRPFHKEYIDVSGVLKCWPIQEATINVSDKTDYKSVLFIDENIEKKDPYDPLQQTLAEEISSKYIEQQSLCDQINENNFSMGFGEGSGRVKNISEDGNNISKFSAATLSDVKQSQPFLLSEDYEDYEKCEGICKSNKDQFETFKRYLTYIQLRDKVRSFFKKTAQELNYHWLKDNVKNRYERSVYDKNKIDFPYDLVSLDFIEPAPVEAVVQVVQVGQLPVSTAAQNPITCDPRVTQVTDASPSQCSAENSPNDDSQPLIKTEYTELTTADLSLPLVHEYERQMKSQESSKVPICNENIPVEMEITQEIKIEPIKEEPDDYNENDDLESLVNKHINNVEYSYDSQENNSSLEAQSNNNMIFETLENHNSEFISQQKQQNGSTEKTDQIAHAMNAAGITTTPEIITNQRAHELINIMSPQMGPEASNPVPQSNNYSKPSINAMSLQQALAQILPPPLNQTNSQDNNQAATNASVTSQVLHIVQGKNTNGNQITLVDNTHNSVINNSNTPVLHIVQNKGVNNNSTSNANGGQHSTTSYGGLSLVDAGLQQGNNQLLHIVNTGNQKNPATGQLLKRVNLLTNLTNVQGTNDQKMVQFLCKAADGKAIQLNASHQRSMVLRLQPIESSNIQMNQKPECQDLSPSTNTNIITSTKESINTQHEIKSRSVYEENYAKFIQNSSNKPIPEKSTSLPKFNQAFGKQVFQDGNQKSNDINSNTSHLSSVNLNNESSECQSSDNINLDHIGQINSPPLLLRKSSAQTPQAPSGQANLVQHIKQTISPMNIQTMHGGVIYTRQIPVNIGGGQTINLITVPSTELIDEANQKQQNDVKFVTQSEIDSPIIKIVPQNQALNVDCTSDESISHTSASNESTQNTPSQHQPVLTQMRIKLPMLSKAPQMVSGTRVVRPSFFQIQRNVIGGANQPVYQQLVLTAAPPLGQHTIRLPQTQTTRQVKVTSESQSSPESQMSSSTLEQLREFDMVLEQVKERSTVQPNGNSTFPKLHTPSSDTTDGTSITSTVTESTQQVLYSIGSNQSVNVAYVSRKPNTTASTPQVFVRSPDSSGVIESPSSSTHVQIPHTVTSETTSSEGTSQSSQPKAAKVGSKSKSRPKSSHSSSSLKLNTVPTKTSTQKPLEDEQTTQRILYILAEYKEQVENSPDKDKPAPRRRSNPPSNPGSSKRKKSSSSSSGSRRPGARDISPIHGDETCRTMGSEDSSCGTSQGDCNESCLESHSPQDSPRKVVRKLTFENETPRPRPQPQRNVIVADGQTITVARGTAGKPTTAVLMPANYILPVSMVKGGQQIAIVTNRGPKLLTVGGGEGGATNALLLQRLIGPAGLKPVLARPGVRHVRLPTAALHNLQAFNLATATTIQPPDSTAQAHTPPGLVETRTASSPWTDRESRDVKPERGSSPEDSEPWNLPSSADPHDYSYEETVRTDNMDRTVLGAIPDRYSPEMEAQRIFDKMFDVDSKKSYIVDSQDDSSRCAYDIDASDSDDKAYHQVVQRKEGGSHRHHRLTHVSAAALRHKYAILEHELRLQGTAFLQKSLSEECEDLGVDSPSASELFPEAELLFSASPAHDAAQHSHTPQPTILNHSGIPQPDMDDQIATDRLLHHDIADDQQDLGVTLGLDEGIVTVSEDGMQATIALDQEEFARSHPNTTFHSEPTEEGEVQPFTITGLKGRHITSTIFHAGRAPATVLVTAPQTTVISQAHPDHGVHNNVKFANINHIINSSQGNLNLSSVLVKDDGLRRFDSILTDSRELHLSNTASAIVHSTGNATQVIRRVCYEDDKRDTRFLMDEPEGLIAGDDAKMVAEDSSRDATLESMAGDVDDDSLPERHAELFWESNSASERSESRRPLDFSSDSEKCCKSPSYDETNSTDSSGVGTHMRLDSVIKNARGLERSGSADGSSADDTHPPLRTYPPKRMYHTVDNDMERSVSGKTRAGFQEERAESLEIRRRASGRGVVKRGCHCCNGSPAPPRPKKPRQRKPTMDFTSN